MSTAAVIAIVIGVVVVLAAVSFFTLARRSDVRGAGASPAKPCSVTSRRAAPPPPAVESAATTAAEVEAAGSANRTHQHRARPGRPRRANSSRGPRRIPRRSVSPRRQFFNRATVALMSVGLVTSPPRRSSASCGRPARAASAARSTSASSATIKDGIKQGNGLLLRARGRVWITDVPGGSASRRPKPCLRRPLLVTACDRASWSSARSARTSAAASRMHDVASGSSASATARSTTASVRRRRGPAPAAWTASRRRSRRTATSSSTPASGSPGPPIGTNTTGQEAEGPHCTGGGHH